MTSRPGGLSAAVLQRVREAGIVEARGYGPTWEQALPKMWSRMRIMIAASRLPIPRGDTLAWAAQTERLQRDRRLFQERMSQDCPLWLSLRPLFFGFVRFVLRWVGGCFRGW